MKNEEYLIKNGPYKGTFLTHPMYCSHIPDKLQNFDKDVTFRSVREIKGLIYQHYGKKVEIEFIKSFSRDIKDAKTRIFEKYKFV